MRKQLLATAVTIPMVFVGIVWGVGSALACDSHCQFSRGQISGGQLMHAQQQEWRLQQVERRQQYAAPAGNQTVSTNCFKYRSLAGNIFGGIVGGAFRPCQRVINGN